jgi:copper resistance protein D
MTLADSLIMWLHLICASVWVGGSVFLGMVLAPVLGTMTETVEERVALMIRIGRRFNNIALPSFAILIITGLYNSRAFFAEPALFFGTSYGIILLIKIILVIMTLITYIVHVKLLNEKIEKKIMGSDTGNVYVQSIRCRIIYLGRITVIMSLVILLLASLLQTGGVV